MDPDLKSHNLDLFSDHLSKHEVAESNDKICEAPGRNELETVSRAVCFSIPF